MRSNFTIFVLPIREIYFLFHWSGYKTCEFETARGHLLGLEMLPTLKRQSQEMLLFLEPVERQYILVGRN